MPNYRLIFPVPEGTQPESAHQALITNDTYYKVGDEITHGGKAWRVTQAPLDDPIHGETADLMVWPVD
jgi:chitodextrinase